MRVGISWIAAPVLSLAFFAPSGARAFAQADIRSPDGRYLLVARADREGAGEGRGLLARGGLALVDVRTGRELGAYDPRALAFEVMWSPDGRLVAINAEIDAVDGELTVWRVAPSGWRLAHLPPLLRRGEGEIRALDRLLPRAYAGRAVSPADGVVPVAERWHGPRDLEASLALDGRERRREILASFSVVVRFFRMGCEVVAERRTSLKVLE